MKTSTIRLLLIIIFLIGLILSALGSILSYFNGAITHDDLIDCLLKLLAVYSVHLALIIGGIIGQKKIEFPDNLNFAPKYICWLAILLSIFWNILLMWRIGVFTMAAFNENMDDSVGKLIDYINKISSASSFLVSGVLAYFFASQEKNISPKKI